MFHVKQEPPMHLWIDDFRAPPGREWHWVKNSEDAIAAIRDNIIWTISFDHDLGGVDTVRPVVVYIEKRARAGHAPPPFYVHSMNPVGKEWIIAQMDRIHRDFYAKRETVSRGTKETP